MSTNNLQDKLTNSNLGNGFILPINKVDVHSSSIDQCVTLIFVDYPSSIFDHKRFDHNKGDILSEELGNGELLSRYEFTKMVDSYNRQCELIYKKMNTDRLIGNLDLEDTFSLFALTSKMIRHRFFTSRGERSDTDSMDSTNTKIITRTNERGVCYH
ncbi:hypothetical protein H8356DRAFT_1420590 [Neocallimastix lanati (nom. inval.)]|nr:hypothetical protein H8356DRAFT_1420590 [Neocallimastix sp. JGI-2020a]